MLPTPTQWPTRSLLISAALSTVTWVAPTSTVAMGTKPLRTCGKVFGVPTKKPPLGRTHSVWLEPAPVIVALTHPLSGAKPCGHWYLPASITSSAPGLACPNCFQRFSAALALVTPSVGAPKSATNFLLTVGDGPGSGGTGVVPLAAGSAAAPAARRRKLRRGSFIYKQLPSLFPLNFTCPRIFTLVTV